MKLRELEAEFIRYIPDGKIWHHVDNLADAHGVMFLCPKCYAENKGPKGTHRVICWFTGKVADDVSPKPGRWNPKGTGIDDLTFVPPGSVSVQLLGGCNWHGFVTNGESS